MAPKEVIKFNGMEVAFCLNERDTNGSLTMFECTIDAGAMMPAPHYHKFFDETVYGLKGTVSYVVDGKPVEIGPGDSLFIPRGVVHGFANKSNEQIKFLAIANPGVFGPSYFRDVAEVLNAGGPPDMAKLKGVLEHHGLVPVMG
jgi:quercetin dioxygenase-like cupin family protein